MAAWSAEIANEFIRRAAAEGRALTQMQLQKLVYIAHGWNLAINGDKLTRDDPQAWDYGPVYRDLWNALRSYGRAPVTREIRNGEYLPEILDDETAAAPARARLDEDERAIIDRVYQTYGRFHAFKLSALTHEPDTPWTDVYAEGDGRFQVIEPDMIRRYFLDLAARQAA
ncbi:DUF4065 domain-containing protein [Sphingomonas psychrotolerans]|uniref:DUF4065 domain-containing protein n=1 Tax=Sphingomonas psychrotolerans TaxID=1327635 RepID=A0ABU3N4C7_9SPHN|nr:type II toxin-antitoxin system antitoxin SocA domain-containing protein [Sphingomonas psychrotolerans]MDT8759233.1 DUF4065 domain-containing protein [Sphingomonas psychrotolerans]